MTGRPTRPRTENEPLRSEIELLRACLADLAERPATPELLQALLERSLAFFEADQARIRLLGAGGERSTLAERPADAGDWADGEALEETVLESGEPRAAELAPPGAGQPGVWITAPLRHGGRLLGLLQLGGVKAGAEPLAPLLAVAGCAAAALAATPGPARDSRDAITGLSNHARFWSRLEMEFQRAERHRRSVGLVMIDVDDFKAYNDRLGHPAGDDALSQVARIAESGSRAHDLVARYGGEEFAVLLPETDDAGALCYAEKLRRSVETACFGPGGGESLTVSVGVASSEGDVASPRELVALAQERLDRAKREGRNQVCTGLD